MDKVSPMDLYSGLRAAINQLIKDNPDASAKDVLAVLELSEGMLELIIKQISKGKYES